MAESVSGSCGLHKNLNVNLDMVLDDIPLPGQVVVQNIPSLLSLESGHHSTSRTRQR